MAEIENRRSVSRDVAEIWPRIAEVESRDVADAQPRRGRTVSPGDRRDAAEPPRCGRARHLGLDEHKIGLELLESALRSVTRVVRLGKVGPAQANLAGMGVRLCEFAERRKCYNTEDVHFGASFGVRIPDYVWNTA